MDSMSFAEVSQWVLTHGYFLMFIGMLVWGPPVTAAGAFGAALGYFNLWIVFILSIASNLLGDVIFYALGYWGRQEFVRAYGKYLGITKPRLRIFEKIAENHVGKAMVISKLVPLLALPGLVVMGITRVPMKTYVWWAIVITLPSSLAYLILGYYFGAVYDTIERYLHLGGVVITLLIALFAVGLHLARRFSNKMEERAKRE
jgi:membrane protein DedA with SNARE-associated domain